MISRIKDAGYFDLSYRILVVGESNVGKYQLIKRYTRNQLGGVYLRTLGKDFLSKIIDIENKKVRLQMGFCRTTSTHGFVLVYNITDRETFEKINFWMEQIKLKGPENAKSILVGNKYDLSNQRVVSIEEGENFAKKYNIKFFEASDKDGTNVNELFFHLANEIYQDSKLKGEAKKN